GRGRSLRGIYDRGTQRRAEQWSAVSRAASWLFGRPDWILSALGSPSPVENDGRVLSRGVQAALGLLQRLPGADAAAWGPGADVELARRRMRQSAGFLLPLRTDVYSSGRVIPGPDGAPPIPLRIYRRFGAFPMAPRPLPPAIVFYHGGGWVVGDVEGYERHCRMLAAVTRCTVISVDYRLAPEHPFPAAVDDSLAAYQWVQRHTDELGVAAGQVAVMGDSAGGNLAAVISLLTRPGGRGSAPDVPPPIVQGLVYPAVDAHMNTETHRTLSVDYILTRDGMDWFRSCYLPDRSDWTSPEASPLLADDHRGLPPALVVTAGFDPLRDEGTAYADALRNGGVPVTYRCYDDQVHGFISMGIVPDTLALTIEVFDTMGHMVRAAADAVAA
ncbi:MAG: alpha/beta hydrolase, partial [Acidimicrobiales bacterium]